MRLFIPALCCTLLAAQTNPTSEQRIAELEARVKALEQKISELLPRPAPEPAAPVQNEPKLPLERISVRTEYEPSGEGETRLPVSGYMEAHYNKFRGEPAVLDFHRFTLLFGHSFSSRIKFWSEVELEHALVEGGEETGELALEQAYLDFLLKPYLNFRGGMLLAPVGIINERHEAPSFNGVERPFVETFIIPSTWRDIGAGLTGVLGKGFRYRAYVMGGLDATGFSAEEGIRGGRTLGFDSSFRNPAKVLRIEHTGVPRLALGGSFYSGYTGFRLESVNPRVDLFSLDARFRHSRFDFRGLFANVWISRAGDLNLALQREVGFNPNIASQLRGWYLEPGIRVLPRRARQDVILFTRYEKFNTQHRMPEGFTPLPQFNQHAWFAGVTYKPNADVALKFDYVWHRSASRVVQVPDGVNLGLGWWF